MTEFEKVSHFMRKPWVICVYAILIVLAYYWIDRFLAVYFHHLDLGSRGPLLSILTDLGKWTVYVVVFFGAGLYFRYIRINPEYEARSWYLLGCIFIANLACLILKVTVSRARPELLFSSNEYGFYWFRLNSDYWSFPSGHTTTIISLATGLGVLFQRYFYILLFIAFLVAVSRIVLCFHYLSDVMSASYISILVVSFFTEYLKGKVDSKKRMVLFGN